MQTNRQIKDALYEQVARLAKAMANPKRLEIIEVLCQGETSVEQLAAALDIPVQLASAHLQTLKSARLLVTRREGKHIYYRLADSDVADLWVVLRTQAESRLLELQSVLRDLVAQPQSLSPFSKDELLAQARHGDVIVLDVRPAAEYASAHLPFALSIPLDELPDRLGELPEGKPIVAYCRGPFCLMARDAVELLLRHGRQALHLPDGVAEWRVQGLPLET